MTAWACNAQTAITIPSSHALAADLAMCRGEKGNRQIITNIMEPKRIAMMPTPEKTWSRYASRRIVDVGPLTMVALLIARNKPGNRK